MQTFPYSNDSLSVDQAAVSDRLRLTELVVTLNAVSCRMSPVQKMLRCLYIASGIRSITSGCRTLKQPLPPLRQPFLSLSLGTMICKAVGVKVDSCKRPLICVTAIKVPGDRTRADGQPGPRSRRTSSYCEWSAALQVGRLPAAYPPFAAALIATSQVHRRTPGKSWKSNHHLRGAKAF